MRLHSSRQSPFSDFEATGFPMSEHVTHVSDDDFEAQVLQSDTPVLVDFWAEWCGPCKAIAPLLDDIAQSYQGKLKIAKVNKIGRASCRERVESTVVAVTTK